MTHPPATNRDVTPDVLRQALNALDNMVVLSDPSQEDNPLVWVNDYFCEFTGYSREDALGRNCRFLQGDDRDQPARYELARAIGSGDSTNAVIVNYKKDGTLFHNDLYISPVRGEDGEILYFVGVQNDVTARVNAQSEVAEREREIDETAENERERFGMEIHDGLGQELAGISLLAKSLHRVLSDGESPHAPAAERLLELLENALDSARQMARGLNPVEASPFGLADALRTLCDTMDSVNDGVSIRAKAEPVSFEDRREARHLYRIAQEALSNAARHSGADEVIVTLQSSSESVRLEVRDNGMGVPDDLLRLDGDLDANTAMGLPASRVEVARRGMGLYGMRYRAELIGAAFSIDTPPSGGTVVRCVLDRDGAGRESHRVRHGERE